VYLEKNPALLKQPAMGRTQLALKSMIGNRITVRLQGCRCGEKPVSCFDIAKWAKNE